MIAQSGDWIMDMAEVKVLVRKRRLRAMEMEEKSTKTPARVLIGFRPKKQFLLSVIPDLANLF
ncbi:MAG: hypothetical protein GQ533_06175 [Methanosarcinaceae archaeon]|nr:hypothetical protein [Methanosarcinaceae archaeon]